MELPPTMSQPFRIGVMQLTMEPVGEILAHARLMGEQGIDTIWLAEAYPWWRKHQMEARSSTALSPLIASATERLTIGWGIISPYTRHPIQVGMEARVTQETAGPGRFRLGFGASKIFMKEIGEGEDGRRARPLAAIRDSVNIVRGVLAGEELDYEGRQFSAKIPALSSDADAPRDEVPIYIGATGPKMRQLAAELADGLLLPSITTPAFTAYARSELDQAAAEAGRDPAAIDLGCTIVASIHPTDREKGRAGAREIAGMYLANKVQNIQGAADTLLELAGLSRTRWSGAAASPPLRPSPTRCSTNATRSPALPKIASPRSTNTATRAAPTSCSSSGVMIAPSRSRPLASRFCPRWESASIRAKSRHERPCRTPGRRPDDRGCG